MRFANALAFSLLTGSAAVPAAERLTPEVSTFKLAKSGHICEVPPYPIAAAASNAQGTTKLQYEVDSSGAISKVSVLQSSGPTREHRLLDLRIAEAVKAYKQPMAKLPLAGIATFEWVWRIAP